MLHPGHMFIERYGVIRQDMDVVRYAEFLRHEAGMGDTPPIDLTCIHQHFNIPQPKLAALPGQQGFLLNGETGEILIDSGDPSTRQRFTNAHELIELLFNAHAARADFDHRLAATKEQLCNRGAAALLMPHSSFLPFVARNGVNFAVATQLATLYDTSLLAALFQMITIGPGAHALALWRYALKPSQERETHPETQLTMLDVSVDFAPAKELRVWWAIHTDGLKSGFIPRHKSVSEESLIANAHAEQSMQSGYEFLALGPVKGRCFVEAKPVTIGGEKCVVSLIHLPTERNCRSIQRSLDF